MKTRSGPISEPHRAALEAKTRQWEALQTLHKTVEGARLQLNSTLSAMSTVYTQTVNLNAKELDAAETIELRREVEEQLQRLEDLSGAVDELYGEGLRRTPNH